MTDCRHAVVTMTSVCEDCGSVYVDEERWVDLPAIEAAAARRALERSGVAEALRFLSTYEKDPPEVMYDQWAYDRLLSFVHDVATCALDGVPTAPGWSSRPYAGAIRQALAALPRPEEPRVERCAVCGVGRWVIAHDPEAGSRYHPFTPESR